MAATEPTLPTAVSISVAPVAIRRVPTVGTVADSAALVTALADAQFGDQIVLAAGTTYTGNFVLKVPTGTLAGAGGDNYVTIISANSASLPSAGTRVALADASNMPTLTANTGASTTPVLKCSADAAHHYRFVGIRFLAPGEKGRQNIVNIGPVTNYSTAAYYPSNFSFERCIFTADFDYGTQKGLQMDCSDGQVIDSYFTNCRQIGNADANAIFVYTGKGPYRFYNNLIEGMGENFFCGSASHGGVPVTVASVYRVPADLTIENNYIRHPLSWKRDDASYVAPCPAAGVGTISSHSGTTLTISTAHGLVMPAGNYTLWIKDVTSGEYRKITAVPTTTTFTLASAFTADPDGHSWQYNGYWSGSEWVQADLTKKNQLEIKAAERVLIKGNTFEYGWLDGQPNSGALTITGREYGYIRDLTIQDNTFISCVGLAITCGDNSQMPSYGATPYPLSRLKVSNNLFRDHSISTMQSLTTLGRGATLTTNLPPFGQLAGGGNAKISATTTGAGRTITATASNFDSIIPTDGTWEIWLCDATNGNLGKATITGYTSGTQLTVTVTTAFDASATSGTGPAYYRWRIGPSTLIQTRLTPDSWIIDHNTFAGTTGYSYPLALISDEGTLYEPISAMTNFTMRNNLMKHGSAGGLVHIYNTIGAGNEAGGGSHIDGADLTFARYGAADVFNKNVFFGNNAYTTYSSGYSSYDAFQGPTTAHQTVFHDGTSDLGFTDYAGGNYAVTGDYATAATDGTMIGCDYASVSATSARVIAGTGNPFRFLPRAWS